MQPTDWKKSSEILPPDGQHCLLSSPLWYYKIKIAEYSTRMEGFVVSSEQNVYIPGPKLYWTEFTYPNFD